MAIEAQVESPLRQGQIKMDVLDEIKHMVFLIASKPDYAAINPHLW